MRQLRNNIAVKFKQDWCFYLYLCVFFYPFCSENLLKVPVAVYKEFRFLSESHCAGTDASSALHCRRGWYFFPRWCSLSDCIVRLVQNRPCEPYVSCSFSPPQMRVLVIGAAGRVAGYMLKQAAADGHEVFAMARNPDKIKFEHARVTRIKGDLNDATSVDAWCVPSFASASWPPPPALCPSA